MSNFTPGPWNISRLASPDYAPEFAVCAGGGVRDLALVIGADSEDNARLIAAAPKLLDELKKLYKAYVNLLESGRDRIVDLGGTCDAVSVMEASDPSLRAARAAINEATGE